MYMVLFGILKVSYGGPVIGFQVENEYTYYSNDSNYMRAVHDVGK